MATAPADVRYGSLDQPMTVDVAVLGGGIAGLTTALLCQRAGRSVAVIEASGLASGVTGYTTAKITALQEPIYAELASHFGPSVATAYATANLAALDRIDRTIAELGIECAFERRPAYTYATTDEGAQRLEAERESAQEAGLDVRPTTETGLPFDVASALRLDDQAQFHARRYCHGLAEAIVAGGGVIVENLRATHVKSGDPCVVQTEKEEVRAPTTLSWRRTSRSCTEACSSRRRVRRGRRCRVAMGWPVGRRHVSFRGRTRSVRARVPRGRNHVAARRW